MAEHVFGSARRPPNPVKIEYDGPPYDVGTPFHSFPARRGWTVAGTQDLRIPPSDRQWLECWLYFGFLHAVFDNVQHEDFIREEDGRRYLTTANLWRYVDAALAAAGKSEAGERIVLGKCSQAGFLAVERRVRAASSNPVVRRVARPEMLFLVRVLHASLMFAIDREMRVFNSIPMRPRDEWADEQMRLRGWCRSQVSYFTNFHSVLPQAYALQLQRPDVESFFGTRKDHSRCTARICHANMIDEETYETRHCSVGCGCSHVEVPIEQVQDIVRSGGIPLIRVSGDDEGPLELHVSKYRPGTAYVAMSHVWSDGLGNTKGNSLPTCQLQWLRTRTSELLWDRTHVPGVRDNPIDAIAFGGRHILHAARSLTRSTRKDTLFWIDTLCIPREKKTRNMAIKSMKKVYEKCVCVCVCVSHRVLVFDSELASTPSKGVPPEEALIRALACSGWMRRLWTLQEGLAARGSLYVLFQDQFVNMPDLVENLWYNHYRGKFSPLQGPVALSAFTLWYLWFSRVNITQSKWNYIMDKATYIFEPTSIIAEPWELVAETWGNVSSRETSKVEDRPVVLANIIDLDPGPILAAKGAPERMKVWYSMLSKFPKSIVFLPGKRYEEYGWRWALECCYQEGEKFVSHKLGFSPGKITPQGLLADFVGFKFDLSASQTGYLKSEGVLRVQTTRVVMKNGQKEAEPRQIFLKLSNGQPCEISALRYVGVIFERSSSEVRHSLFEEGEETLRCIVISVRKQEEGVIFGRYEFLADAVGFPGSDTDASSTNGVRLTPESLLEDQKWCIG